MLNQFTRISVVEGMFESGFWVFQWEIVPNWGQALRNMIFAWWRCGQRELEGCSAGQRDQVPRVLVIGLQSSMKDGGDSPIRQCQTKTATLYSICCFYGKSGMYVVHATSNAIKLWHTANKPQGLLNDLTYFQNPSLKTWPRL